MDPRPPDGDGPGAAQTAAGPGPGPGGQPGKRQPPGDATRSWDTRPGRLGVLVVVAAAAVGALVTILLGQEPGTLLGAFVLAGTAFAVLAVRPRAVYLIIPVPALAYCVAATIAGLVHDHATDTSRTALAVSAAQWIASGFTAMATATILAVVTTIASWLWRRGGPRQPR